VTAEVEERLGEAISLHLFATADNTLVPRFFALYPAPLAEGADALAQLDWGVSLPALRPSAPPRVCIRVLSHYSHYL
jgi:hypothetical protein